MAMMERAVWDGKSIDEMVVLEKVAAWMNGFMVGGDLWAYGTAALEEK